MFYVEPFISVYGKLQMNADKNFERVSPMKVEMKWHSSSNLKD